MLRLKSARLLIEAKLSKLKAVGYLFAVCLQQSLGSLKVDLI